MPVTALLLRLSDWLPDPLRIHASEARIRLLVQFVMFAMVGLIGFAIDTATVYALRARGRACMSPGSPPISRPPPAPGSSTGMWTFRHIVSTDSWHVQWRRFLAANLTGFVINRGVYALLVTFVDVAARQPVIAVFAGALAGMTLNFNLSRKMVFR